MKWLINVDETYVKIVASGTKASRPTPVGKRGDCMYVCIFVVLFILCEIVTAANCNSNTAASGLPTAQRQENRDIIDLTKRPHTFN